MSRVQAILLSNDLISTTGEPFSGRAEQDSLAGSSKSRALRELHSLTGVHGKNKAVSAVQWTPQRKVQECFLLNSSTAKVHAWN